MKQAPITSDAANSIVVDICITTEWKELEGVCIIAELLHRREYHCFAQGERQRG